jgi:hypothetical protein
VAAYWWRPGQIGRGQSRYVSNVRLFQRLFDVQVGDRCSAGKTADGQKFQDTHPDWRSGLVSPWYEFLRLRHRKFI